MAGFIAGPYNATWNALAVGITEDGFEWQPTGLAEMIRGDNMGDTIQDTVYRGSLMSIELVLEQFDALAMATLLWPYHATFGNHGQAGVLGTTFSKPLVLTAVAGTSASTVPATMTWPLTMIHPDFQSRIKMASRLRKVPIRLIAFPNASNVFWTQT